MRKILLSLIFVLSFSLAVRADIPPPTSEGTPSNVTEEKKPNPQGNCMGAVLFSIGIFLLGQHLIRKSQTVSSTHFA